MSRLLAVSLVLLAAGADQTGAAGDVQSWGAKFTPQTKIAFKVPDRSFSRLPSEVPVYSAERTPFTQASVEWLIDRGVADAAERETLKRKVRENPSLLTQGKTTLKKDDWSQITVNPDEGMLLFSLQPHALARMQQTAPPPGPSNSVATAAFHNTLRDLLARLGWSDAEIARKPNGDYDFLAGDTKKFPNHQKEAVIYEKEVTYTRQVAGCAMASGSYNYQIYLAQYVSGEWQKIYVHWPKLKSVAASKVYHSNDELRRAIEAGKGLWDHNNEFRPSEVRHITVTNVRLIYCTSKTGRADPIMCLDADMKMESGTDYGTIFLPLP